MKNKIKITLNKSLIGRIPAHIEIAKQLGLKKVNSTVIQPDNPSIRGMVNKINYLVNVEENVK
ncbi:50S ribosomal protein L30 [Legionella impletisoli]|uniref:Large ribosomal subunit protein uL30 n=1 Tax=Legionella impletisoli TaxID=343510 RepID=A0A917JTL4_9GAMM|nr:50S ribosomal protein L30 [Legionella impletisoli]GGI83462.1 50S ribosomal protein L30 [Legionella impletisoli]